MKIENLLGIEFENEAVGKFYSFEKHPRLGKIFKRLNTHERLACREFLATNGQLNKNEFNFNVNRWFLDDPNKPKHHADMWALVSECK